MREARARVRGGWGTARRSGLVVALLAGAVWLAAGSEDSWAQRAPSKRPGTASASRPASGPAASQPAVTQQQFMQVMQQRCVRCHKQCASVPDLVRARWVVAGQPDASRLYTITTVGPNKVKAHIVPEKERQLLRDFIQQMK